MEEKKIEEEVVEDVEEELEEEEFEEIPEDLIEEDSEVEVEPEPEEKCVCYSVEPPKRPWKSTYVFATYDCTLCGRRVKK